MSKFILIMFICLSVFACQNGGGKLSLKDENKKIVKEAEVLFLLDPEIIANPKLSTEIVKIPPVFTNDTWENTGGEADHTYHHLSLGNDPTVQWKNTIANNKKAITGRLPQPVLANNIIYAMDEVTNVVAINVKTGKKIWSGQFNRLNNTKKQKNKKHFGYLGGLSIGDGHLFIVSGAGIVSSVSLLDGSINWQKTTSEPIRTAPTYFNHQLFVVTIANNLLVYNTKTGNINWRNGSFEEPVKVISNVAPALVEDMAIIPFSTGEIMALKPSNGRKYWNDALGRTTNSNNITSILDIAAPPIIDRNLVIVAGHSGIVVAYDRLTGQRVWENNFITTNMPWVAGDYIYFVTSEQKLLCIQRKSGGIIWVTQLRQYKNEKKQKGEYSWFGPILAGERLIVTSDKGEILSLSPFDGSDIANFDLKDKIATAPFIVDNAIYILSISGTIYKLQ